VVCVFTAGTGGFFKKKTRLPYCRNGKKDRDTDKIPEKDRPGKSPGNPLPKNIARKKTPGNTSGMKNDGKPDALPGTQAREMCHLQSLFNG
jgi:hypothetical protein